MRGPGFSLYAVFYRPDEIIGRLLFITAFLCSGGSVKGVTSFDTGEGMRVVAGFLGCGGIGDEGVLWGK